MDAGFVEGDEVSSHYDPMIAKLIVQGTTREVAIQKLHAALGEYEIVGPMTNIEFLKKLCVSPAFVAGEVETGFIPKFKDELFRKESIVPEVYAQAALGTYLAEAAPSTNGSLLRDDRMGFLSSVQSRDFRFTEHKGDGTTSTAEIAVNVNHVGPGLFDITVNGKLFPSVASHWDSQAQIITSYFLHTRLDTRLISDDGNLTLFQHGQQYRLRFATPAWIEKALGIKDNAHSVLAPMPCKILRVQVTEGETVKKDQPLVVIESMKMETVIRSPQDGKVARVVHQQGVCACTCPNAFIANSRIGSL